MNPGSYIYRKNNGAAEPHYLCRTIKRGWKRIWPPAGTDLKCTDPSNIACLPEDWAPLLSECWGFDMTLAYNAKTNVYSSPPGPSHPKAPSLFPPVAAAPALDATDQPRFTLSPLARQRCKARPSGLCREDSW